MQDWFISWVFMDDDDVTARGWNIRRADNTTEAAEVAQGYLNDLAKEHNVPAERLILTAMNKV